MGSGVVPRNRKLPRCPTVARNRKLGRASGECPSVTRIRMWSMALVAPHATIPIYQQLLRLAMDGMAAKTQMRLACRT